MAISCSRLCTVSRRGCSSGRLSGVGFTESRPLYSRALGRDVSKTLQARSKSLSTVGIRIEAQAVSELPGNLEKIVTTFQTIPDMLEKYKQLLLFASKLDPLPYEDRVKVNRVHGCVSQVWVKARLTDGVVNFQAASDAQLTKGLAALLVVGLSGCSPQEILQIQPDFIEMLGCKQGTTPSRNNGFLNMFRMMQKRALDLASADLESKEVTIEADGTADSAGNGSSLPSNQPPVEDAIKRKPTDELDPEELTMENASVKHAGHGGNPEGGPKYIPSRTLFLTSLME